MLIIYGARNDKKAKKNKKSVTKALILILMHISQRIIG